MSDLPEWIRKEINRVWDHNPTELNLSLPVGDKRSSLKYIPEEICELTHLTTLNLSGHNIQKIPDKLQNLTQLTALHIEGSYLVIPEWIGA